MLFSPTFLLFSSIFLSPFLRLLLSHAEVAEDVSQHFVGLDFAACYFAKGVETTAEVLTYEVGGQTGGKSVEYSLYVGKGGVEG